MKTSSYLCSWLDIEYINEENILLGEWEVISSALHVKILSELFLLAYDERVLSDRKTVLRPFLH